MIFFLFSLLRCPSRRTVHRTKTKMHCLLVAILLARWTHAIEDAGIQSFTAVIQIHLRKYQSCAMRLYQNVNIGALLTKR